MSSDLLQLRAALGSDHQSVHPCSLSEQCSELFWFQSFVSFLSMHALCRSKLTYKEH